MYRCTFGNPYAIQEMKYHPNIGNYWVRYADPFSSRLEAEQFIKMSDNNCKNHGELRIIFGYR